MKQIDLREGARRQHRAVAVFATIQCWQRGLDGIVFERVPLERLLGLDKFKKTRIDWMKEDFREYFPFQKVNWFKDKVGADGKLNSFASFWVGRLEFDKFLPSGTSTTKKRLAGMPADGPKMATFKIWQRMTISEIGKASEAVHPFLADFVNVDDRLLASYLLLLIQGQISPKSLPSLRAD